MQRFNGILLTLVGRKKTAARQFITEKKCRDENWKWETIKQAKRSIATLWLQILWLLLHLSVCQSILGHHKIHFVCLIFPHRFISFDHNIDCGFLIESYRHFYLRDRWNFDSFKRNAKTKSLRLHSSELIKAVRIDGFTVRPQTVFYSFIFDGTLSIVSALSCLVYLNWWHI